MKKAVVIVLSGFILWSCNKASEKSTEQQDTEVLADNLPNETVETIELNSGEKWLVNNEMKPFVLKGSELVDTYVKNKDTDYVGLAQQIKDQNSQLIKSCTMDGKSHDELHKWLHPHLSMVKELENAADESKANEIVLQLQNSYQQYHQYFN